MKTIFKPMLLSLFLLPHVAFAENTTVPTCDINKKQPSLSKLSTDKLLDKISVSAKRYNHCDTAVGYIELYSRGVAQENKKVVIHKIFSHLKEGHFLNEYTASMIALNEDMKLVDLKKINEDHARIYFKFIKQESTNPLSQFTLRNKGLLFFDEAELVFKYFVNNYPNDAFSKVLRNVIVDLQDTKLQKSNDYLDFYDKKNVNSSGHTAMALDHARVLAQTTQSKYFSYGISLLNRSLKKSDIDAAIKDKAEIIISEIQNTGKNRSALMQKLITALAAKRQQEITIGKVDSLKSFIEQKGNDSTVFLPLNKEWKLTASKTLISLGVVGILMAFDEPIMDWVQENNEGTAQQVAEFGNHFGEVSGLAPIIGGTLAYGLVFNNDKAKNAAFASMGAVLLGQLMIETLKSASQRARPEDGRGAYAFDGPDWVSNNTSFASGHSAAAWSVATVFADEFGDDHRWVPYVSYGLAALTSYARVHHNKHWVSDAVMGAMIGFVAGKIFHKLYRKYAAANIENIQFVPLFGSTTGFKFIITSKVYNDLKTWPVDLMYLYQKRAQVKDFDLDQIYRDVYFNEVQL